MGGYGKPQVSLTSHQPLYPWC